MNGVQGRRFADELRISPRGVIAAELIAVWLLVMAGPFLTRSQSFDPSFLLLALVLVAFTTIDFRPRLAGWLAVLILAGVLLLAAQWLELPNGLALLAIPTGLLALFVNPRAAVAAALAETVLLLLVAGWRFPSASPREAALALFLIWSMLGMIVAVFRPVGQLSAWLEEYFARAHLLVEEAKDRRALLEQTLVDLAHANRQLALANERLSAMREIAEEAQKSKAAFVAKVSHEFRTPLNIVTGLINLLVDAPASANGQMSPSLLEDLKVVRRNGEYLADLVNDVLDLSQAESGRLTLYREWVDLRAIIDSALLVVRPLLDKKRLALQVTIDAELPLVYCDQTRIRQVILNLVSNAARFTDSGGVTVGASSRENTVTVEVRDTGPGIPQEVMERVFEPFIQGTSGPWRERGGSGLGLSISKQFIEMHQGRIWLDSTVGAGTVVAFELPISPAGELLGKPGQWIKEEWSWHERTSRTQLPDISYRPRLLVYDTDGSVMPALQRNADKVDLIALSDAEVVSGELSRFAAQALVVNTASLQSTWSRLQALGSSLPDTPLIGISVSSQRERVRATGASGCLTKPITRDALNSAIRSLGIALSRVLVVDDDPDMLRVFKRMLTQEAGLEVTTAADGEQAWVALQGGQFDLVLLDLMLPGMDGWQVLERKRQDPALAGIPVILVTAQDLSEQPLVTPAVTIALGNGLPVGQMLRAAMALSADLLRPDRGGSLVQGLDELRS